MCCKPVTLFICLALLIPQLYAQDKIPIKFGHVSKEDFDISKFNADTTDGAVIIADVGITTFEGNEKGSISLIYKHQRRIKIINKNGLSLANVEIPLYTSSDCEVPLQISSSIKVGLDSTEDIIYFNPIIRNDYTENPLKAIERKYPVEMPYPIDENYQLSIEIPAGYQVDELPRSAKVTFNDTEGSFEYYVFKDESSITLQSRIKFEKATFAPEEYQDLRSFFDYIVKKYSEQIVFKKKK